MRSQFDFSGRSVLVVGASRAGIGAAIADGFASAGASVMITGVEEAPIESYRGRYPYRQLGVSDLAAVNALAEAVPALDILVNCAGVGRRDVEWTTEGFRGVLDVNLVGMFNLANAFKPHLAARKGSFVAIASMYSLMGSPAVPAYGASKAGVAQLTMTLAVAWAPLGIRVNAIAPGFIVTEQTARPRADRSHYERVIARTPMGRWGQPEDIAGPALFLASDQAGFVTGTVMRVDGGLTANL